MSNTSGFNYHKANWAKFREHLAADLGDIKSDGNVEEWSKSFCSVVRRAAEKKRGTSCHGGIRPAMRQCRLVIEHTGNLGRVQLKAML